MWESLRLAFHGKLPVSSTGVERWAVFRVLHFMHKCVLDDMVNLHIVERERERERECVCKGVCVCVCVLVNMQ